MGGRLDTLDTANDVPPRYAIDHGKHGHTDTVIELITDKNKTKQTKQNKWKQNWQD